MLLGLTGKTQSFLWHRLNRPLNYFEDTIAQYEMWTRMHQGHFYLKALVPIHFHCRESYSALFLCSTDESHRDLEQHEKTELFILAHFSNTDIQSNAMHYAYICLFSKGNINTVSS